MSSTIELDSGWAVTRYGGNRQSWVQISMPSTKRPNRLKGDGYDSLSPDETQALCIALLETLANITIICPDSGDRCRSPKLCKYGTECNNDDVPF